MSFLKTFKNLLLNDRKAIPVAVMNRLIKKNITNILPDKAFLKLRYKTIFQKELNLENPETFNEKLQWIKLYDRNPDYTMMVDKYEVRKFVSEKIGEEYLIPCLGIWDKPEDIDYDTLPEKFVLKCTHDSGSVTVCDKSNLNKEEINKKFNKKLKFNMFWWSREWPYKNVKPRIIAEKFMVDESGYELKDYKFFCFNGEVKMLFMVKDRLNKDEETKFDFFDIDFNHFDVRQGHPNSEPPYFKPDGYEKMKELAAKLSEGIPHVRVDFYNINGQIYFGEMTFFHDSGLVPFDPEEWDYKFGEWLELPKIKK